MTWFQNVERPITVPAEAVFPGDLMGRAMDKLRTLHAALSGDGIDLTDMLSYAAVLDAAIRDLEPVRNRLQGVEGRVA